MPIAIERPIRAESGFMLVELLVVMALSIAVIAATLFIITPSTRQERKDQSYAQEIMSTETALTRLAHDLRQASAFVSVSPSSLEFQMVEPVAGVPTTYNVLYNCAASDSLGSPYTRCARTQAVAPLPPPAAPASAGGTDIQHVYNNPVDGYSTYCNTAGSAPSGSVFFVSNPNIANTDGSGLACDENYEDIVAALPDYIQITAQVPASGDLKFDGLTHFTFLHQGVYIPNSDTGA